MKYYAAKGQKIRMVTVLALIGISAAGIVARAVQIQILERDRLQSIAQRQHKETIEVKAKRGDILDRKGEPLAVSREEAQVFARPPDIEDMDAVADKIGSILGMDRGVLKRKLSLGESFLWITRTASIEQAEKIKTLDLPGVGILPASRRFYPGGTLAANILGFTGVDGNGLEGLEFLYEEKLAGRPMKLWIERDARGNSFVLSNVRSPANLGLFGGRRQEPELFELESKGASLKLTIMRSLQYVVERELEEGVKSAGAKAGCILAMDPSTGEILAMASYPTFDPNRFGKYSQAAYRNRCVQTAYEPGSTFKVFTVAAALEHRAVKPGDILYCENGSYELGGETIRDIKKHGWMSIEQIIAHSSNIGASKIGELLGADNLHDAAASFGFGKKTGVDFPGESSGLLRDSRSWSQVAVGTISFGQGIAVTPVQMVSAMSAIANGGHMIKPHLVSEIIVSDGTRRNISLDKDDRVISKETALTVTRFMGEVVSPEGTGKKAMVEGYKVAGKTGTAQKPREGELGYADGLYVASFMGFLPAGDPRLAMIVVIDEPDPRRPWGGEVAAPVFKDIAEKAMMLLNVPSEGDAPAITQDEDIKRIASASSEARKIRQWERKRNWNEKGERRTQGGKMTVPDLRGFTLRQALRELEGLPVQIQVAGTGVVAAQSPEPGALIKGQGAVRLQLEDIK